MPTLSAFKPVGWFITLMAVAVLATWTIRPKTPRDPRLLGTWTSVEKTLDPIQLTFYADGSGQILGARLEVPMPFEWRTHEQRLSLSAVGQNWPDPNATLAYRVYGESIEGESLTVLYLDASASNLGLPEGLYWRDKAPTPPIPSPGAFHDDPSPAR